MYSVILSGLRFQIPIGIYHEEKKLKNDIEINITLSREDHPTNPPLLNYETVYEAVSEETKLPETLLENLLDRIAKRLLTLFPNTKLSVEVRKWHPPFGGQADYAAVNWKN